ncbi:MAG TPA: AAA family ATPase [Candidatus Saccharimonadia bacterium]
MKTAAPTNSKAGAKLGLVVGKFYPPHKGHHFLINTAKQHCDRLIVMVVEGKNQHPDGSTRMQWLKTAHPDVEVRLIEDIYDDDNSQAWAAYTMKLLGRSPDIVFTSETYGDPWARAMGSEHMLVDLERKVVPISASMVRSDPLKKWQFLDPPVRAHYGKRVVIVGAESTGKTTLATALADHYKTSWVPEYGRMYTGGKITSEAGAEWESEEFRFIAEEQNRLEDMLAGYSNKLLICDTDAVATAVWHEHYMKSWSKEVEALYENRDNAFYLVTDYHIPYKQDSIRVGEDSRSLMHERFVELLDKLGRPYVVISGTPEERLKQAVTQCDAVLADPH